MSATLASERTPLALTHAEAADIATLTATLKCLDQALVALRTLPADLNCGPTYLTTPGEVIETLAEQHAAVAWSVRQIEAGETREDR